MLGMPTLVESRDARGTAPVRIHISHLGENAASTLHIAMETSEGTLRLPGFRGPDPLRDEFERLANQWYEETGHLSSPRQIAMHPAYQRIIGLGAPAIPLILRALQERGGQWYWALQAITNESPVAEDEAGNIPRMKEAWLRWGASRGHIAP